MSNSENVAHEPNGLLTLAANLLELDADRLRSTSTVDGVWSAENESDGTKREYDDVMSVVAALKKLASVPDDKAEILRLEKALVYARGGLSLAHDALENGCHDEALLHVGHHGAMIAKALGGEESPNVNQLKKKYNPKGWQWGEDGQTYQLLDLSRDDLLQVACDGIEAMAQVECLHHDLGQVLKSWNDGKLVPAEEGKG